ncbi:hypothetical protein NQF87_05565 [Bombella sp. TMW 2.2559]|uniref:Uncharacterized protein n=1 Tax=Bombella dulcis TaxID=2967339 RepID=A0ABT3WDW8_9PROT|nr:hypothetical protein [Bombella dulcis]MCX5616440.1 hypothetical protein [Bombella dulcis]
MNLAEVKIRLAPLVRLFRTVWPKSGNEVFVLDGKWVILFHVIIVFTLLFFHLILVNMKDF